MITKPEAERLLAFTNNSGPLFVIGAVGVGMFNSAQLGYFLLACHIMACITVGIVFGRIGRKKAFNIPPKEGSLFRRFLYELRRSGNNSNLSGLFGDSIKNSISLVLTIGGFIIFFSVVISLLLETGFIYFLAKVIGLLLIPFGIDNHVLAAILCGFFEITTGTSMVSKTPGVTLPQQLLVASAIIGWAGLSVHSQVLSIINHTDISIKPYLAGKFLQGVFSAIYAYIVMKSPGFFLLKLEKGAVPAFNPLYNTNFDWTEYLLASVKYSFTSCAVLLVLALPFLILTPRLNKRRKKRQLF